MDTTTKKTTKRYHVTGDFSRMVYSTHATLAPARRAARALARKWGVSHIGSEPQVVDTLTGKEVR